MMHVRQNRLLQNIGKEHRISESGIQKNRRYIMKNLHTEKLFDDLLTQSMKDALWAKLQ